jgi:hypothetical protein
MQAAEHGDLVITPKNGRRDVNKVAEEPEKSSTMGRPPSGSKARPSRRSKQQHERRDGGNATGEDEVTTTFHVNTGRRHIVVPGSSSGTSS